MAINQPRPLLSVVASIAGATENLTLTRGLQVLDVTLHCTAANAMATITVGNAGNAITDAIACATDTNVARAGTINDANSTIASAGTMRFTVAAAAAGIVTVICTPA